MGLNVRYGFLLKGLFLFLELKTLTVSGQKFFSCAAIFRVCFFSLL